MKSITIKRSTGLNIAERWRRQYYEQQTQRWLKTATGQSEDIYNMLCDLGPNPEPVAVDAIIGNDSWTHPSCTCCGRRIDKAVMIGDKEDNFILCEPCLEAALIELRKS